LVESWWRRAHGRGVHSLADRAGLLNRSAVCLSGLQKRFELLVFEGATYPNPCRDFFRTVVFHVEISKPRCGRRWIK
jgi:hypothetical protein